MASPAGASEENCNNNDSFVIEIPEELEPELTSKKNIIYRVPRKLRKLNEAAYTPDLISIGPFHHGKRELQAMESHKEEYYKRFCERTGKSHNDLERFIESIFGEVRESYAATTKFENKDLKFKEIIRIDACFIIELFLRNQQLSQGIPQELSQGNNEPLLRNQELSQGINEPLLRSQELSQGSNEPLLRNQELSQGSNEPLLRSQELSQGSNEPLLRSQELSQGSNDEQTSNKDKDYILRTAWLKKAIQLDLILLENQLPYFLLEELYSISKRTSSSSSNTESSEDKKRQFRLLAYRFFEDFCTDEAILDEMEEKKKAIKHFTDFVRQFRLPYGQKQKGTVSRENYVYSATELDKARVTFVVNGKARLAEVKRYDPHFCFCCLRLELAALELDDATELLFRNMIALEQCLYSDEAYIGSYVVLMSQLIKTEEDADFLVEKKIIKNCSKHQVADLFTKLGNEIADSHFYYANDCSMLNQHHDKWLNRTMAKAKKVYFNDLWKGSSTVLGIFLLLFSISESVKNIFLS